MFEEANLSRGSCQWAQWLHPHQCHQSRLIPQAPSETKWQDSVRLCTAVCRYCMTINNRLKSSWQHVSNPDDKASGASAFTSHKFIEEFEPAQQKPNFLNFNTSSPKIKWTLQLRIDWATVRILDKTKFDCTNSKPSNKDGHKENRAWNTQKIWYIIL